MYKFLIERTVTIVYYDKGIEEFKNEDIAGILANDADTIEIIKNMPNSKYYINLNGNIVSLNKTQALVAYNKIIEENNKEYQKAMRRTNR